MFKYFLICITIINLMSLVIAETPKDMLISKTSPRELVDLTNLDIISAKNIDNSNEELHKDERWEMPDIGYMYSYKIDIKQMDNETNTPEIEKFLKNDNQMMENVGNNTNATNISEIDTMPYY